MPKVDTWLTPETSLGGLRFSNLNKVTVRRVFCAAPRRDQAQNSRARWRGSIIHNLLHRAAGFQRAGRTIGEHYCFVNMNEVPFGGAQIDSETYGPNTRGTYRGNKGSGSSREQAKAVDEGS